MLFGVPTHLRDALAKTAGELLATLWVANMVCAMVCYFDGAN